MGIALFQSVAAMVAAINKHVSRATKKLMSHQNHMATKATPPPSPKNPLATPPRRSPLHITKKVSLVIPFLNKKKNAEEEEDDVDEEEEEQLKKDEEVWRRTIIMGEKCEPLDFSGVIYYDSEGKQLEHIPPRSPRHPSCCSPKPTFSFPVLVDAEKESAW